MPDFVYSSPRLLVGLAFVGAFILPAIAGVFLFRHIATKLFAKERYWRETIFVVLQTTVAFFAVLLAFCSLSAVQNFTDARTRVETEAGSLNSLYRDSQVFPDPMRRKIETQIRDYLEYVVRHSWRQMQNNVTPTGAEGFVSQMNTTLASYQPKTNSEQIILSNAMATFSNFVADHRKRVDATGEGLPAEMWLTLTIGLYLIIALTWLLPIESKLSHSVCSAIPAFAMSIILFTVADVDQPFRGGATVSPSPYIQTLKLIEQSS